MFLTMIIPPLIGSDAFIAFVSNYNNGGIVEAEPVYNELI